MATTFLQVKNRALSYLTAALNDSDTSFDVTSGEGSKFPGSFPFHVTCESEIMEVTNRSTDTFTVTRAAEGTTAAAHGQMAAISLNITAQVISELQTGKARTATKVVAASDASNDSKLGSDFVCDGVADDVEIQAAIDALPVSGGNVVLSEGTFVCVASVLIQKNNVQLAGNGEATLLDFSTVSVDYPIKALGAITVINSALTVNAAQWDISVTVANGGLFSTGDWVRIRSEALFNSGTSHFGELRKIKTVVGNVLTFEDNLGFGYLVADTATVDLMTMRENITLSNFKVISTNANNNFGIWFEDCVNVRVRDITFEDWADRSIGILNTVAATVSRCTIRRSTRAGLGYGVSIANASRDIIVDANHFYDCRHAVACSGDSTYGVQLNQVYSNNTATYSAPGGVHANAVGMFGSHNTYRGLVIIGNSVISDGLGYIAGLDTTVANNQVYNDACANGGINIPDGASNVIISGNIISGTQTGIIFYQNGTVSKVNITGNRIESTSGAIYLRGTNITNLSIENNWLYSTGYVPVYFREISVASLSTGITIRNNTIQSDADDAIDITVAANNITDVIISGNLFSIAAAKFGFNCNGGAFLIQGVQIHGNKFIDGRTGIVLQYNVDRVSIHDNEFVDATTQGLWIFTGVTNYDIQDNRFSNCATAITDAVGTGLKRNNIGYVTENSGTATIANGQTTVTVTHGLATTPTRVQVTPTLLSNAASFWITAKGATTFVINVNADPGVGTATFDWRAQVGEG